MTTTTSGIAAVKTRYNQTMEEVFNRLQTGQHKCAKMATPLQMNMKTRRGALKVTITEIGANSFGMEVKIRTEFHQEWTALEQFSEAQQKKMARSVDWDTLT